MGRWAFGILALAVVVGVSYWQLRGSTWTTAAAPDANTTLAAADERPTPWSRTNNLEAAERLCVRVVDGDTIVLDGGERVRYIGVDTPETKHPRKPVQWMGREATQANRILVEGRRVRLEYDVERRDRYGRTLAYVHVGGVMVNERLVRAGYAKISTYPPNTKYVRLFSDATEEGAGRSCGGCGARAPTQRATRSWCANLNAARIDSAQARPLGLCEEFRRGAGAQGGARCGTWRCVAWRAFLATREVRAGEVRVERRVLRSERGAGHCEVAQHGP